MLGRDRQIFAPRQYVLFLESPDLAVRCTDGAVLLCYPLQAAAL